MRNGGGFHALRMTKAQNNSAFLQWLFGCSDNALARADADSLSRSYGVPVKEVAEAIARQQSERASTR
jgi:hypothetical protein